MAKSLTSRFGLQRWSADADTQQRSEFDTNSAQVEALGGIARQGPGTDRGSASAYPRSTFWSTDALTLDYSDGTTWQTVTIGRTRTWTPTITGTGGSPLDVDARYQRIGRLVIFTLQLMTNGTTITGSVNVSLPTIPEDLSNQQTRRAFPAQFYDADTGLTLPGTAVGVFGSLAFKTAAGASLSATAPFTWAANGDQIYVAGQYYDPAAP